MALLPRVTELGALWRERARGLTRRDPALERVLSWIRTIALEDDAFYVDARDRRGLFRFPFPSSPADRPRRAEGGEARARVRFVVRASGRPGVQRGPSGGSDDVSAPRVEEPEWRPILRLRDLQVFERNTAHGPHRPLRLGLDTGEGWAALCRARRFAEESVAGRGGSSSNGSVHELPRLSLRSAMGVALWTRGRLRGSVVVPPGPATRAVGQAAISACQDARFERLSAADLEETRLQVTVVHAPAVPLSRREIDAGDAYHDKGLFLSEETHSGVYLPEIFNVAPHRTLRSLLTHLARDKAGLAAVGPHTSVDVCEVSEFVESAERARAVVLDGPVARVEESSAADASAGNGAPLGNRELEWRSRARVAGVSACAWLAAIQRPDGALPLRVRPSTGEADGEDPSRMAMVAEALAAFGTAIGLGSAIETARRVVAWLERARPRWSQRTEANSLLTSFYVGKVALCLGDEDAADRAWADTLRALERSPPRETLVLAHAASFLLAASERRAALTRRCESLQQELEGRLARAKAGGEPVSLAEWAELVAASSPAFAHEVARWLCSQQLPSGAFPDTTASDFVYTRGTGKVFEVIALRPAHWMRAIERASSWLVAMQYRPDSMFFVPEEHRSVVAGGLRHDMFDADAWIDAAGHFLLGLARLERSA